VAENRPKPTYVRVYADEHGDSHFEDVQLPSETQLTPTGVVAAMTKPLDVQGLVFRLVLSEASDTVPHNAPQRLLIVHLEGAAEVEVSDGEKRRFGPGSVLVLEDTNGKGHVTRNVSNRQRWTLVAPLA
jgi:hypothetical protein